MRRSRGVRLEPPPPLPLHTCVPRQESKTGHIFSIDCYTTVIGHFDVFVDAFVYVFCHQRYYAALCCTSTSIGTKTTVVSTVSRPPLVFLILYCKIPMHVTYSTGPRVRRLKWGSTSPVSFGTLENCPCNIGLKRSAASLILETIKSHISNLNRLSKWTDCERPKVYRRAKQNGGRNELAEGEGHTTKKGICQSCRYRALCPCFSHCIFIPFIQFCIKQFIQCSQTIQFIPFIHI